MTSVKLRCRCGSVLGCVNFSRPSRVRIICHCDDCGKYARQIGSEQAIQIVQVTPDQVTLVHGTDQLRCLRLTERGLTRWFAGCCMTPLANTSRYSWMPFVGLMSGVLDTEDEALLGIARHANGSHPPPWGTLLRSAWCLLLGLLLRRHRPNVFFADNGEPLARPEHLT